MKCCLSPPAKPDDGFFRRAGRSRVSSRRRRAAREAYEEAGVRGRVSGRPLGSYVYEKRVENRVASFPCEVQVFPLLVKTQLKKWPEFGQRKVRWFSVSEAAAVINDDDLRRLILELK